MNKTDNDPYGLGTYILLVDTKKINKMSKEIVRDSRR